MKKILVIAYYFPPAAGVGTFRTAKFVKYLPSFSWESYVLTVKDEYYSSIDDSLIGETKKAKKIYKTKTTKIPINDVGIKWAWPLYKEAKKIIEKERIDVVYFTGGPFFHWVIAPKLKKATKTPYIIDYRDPWGINPYEKVRKGVKKKIGDLIVGYIEPKIIKKSAGVIFATADMEREYGKCFPAEAKKFQLIENGFDPEDYCHIEKKNFSKFSIVYTGKFSYYRDPKNLFKAISSFDKDGKCEFIHVGNKEERVTVAAHKYLKSKSSFVGPKKYKEAISYARGANVLIIISGGSNIEFTHKVFDYISCNRPIIAIANKESYLGRFLSNFENAFIVNDSPGEIESALNRIKNGEIDSLGEYDKTFLKNYKRVEKTKMLANTLNKIIEGKK